MLNRIIAVAKKEIRELKRDKRMLYVLFIFPLILLSLFGYAINFDVHHIKIAVYDADGSDISREFTKRLISSDYFDLVANIKNENETERILDRGDAQAVIVFPRDLSKDFHSGKEAKIQVLVDGVNGNTASAVINYLNLASATFSQKITNEALQARGRKSIAPVSLEARFWFNPELDSNLFLIPGLIAMILIITAVVSISLSVVREKERGTMEQINVSPLLFFELLLGKTIPYTVISLFISAVILFAGNVLFGMPVKGNFLLLFISTLIFLFASLNLGILVSSVAETQQVAFQISTLISFLPSFILSGFVFPIESMPPFIQALTNVTPAKFFVVILRSILLKGAGITVFWEEIIYLIIFAVVCLALAIVFNRKRTWKEMI